MFLKMLELKPCDTKLFFYKSFLDKFCSDNHKIETFNCFLIKNIESQILF